MRLIVMDLSGYIARLASYLTRIQIIAVSLCLALEWERSFGAPWPLQHSFELADTVEEQLWQSLAICVRMRTIGGYRLPSRAYLRSNVGLRPMVSIDRDIGFGW